jgi:chromosome segregation ATPase
LESELIDLKNLNKVTLKERNDSEASKFQMESEYHNIHSMNESLQTQIRIVKQSLESTQSQLITIKEERDILSMDIVKLNKEAIEMEKQLAHTKEALDLKESQCAALESRVRDFDTEIQQARGDIAKNIYLEDNLKSALSQLEDLLKIREEKDFLELRVSTLEQQLRHNMEKSAVISEHFEKLSSKHSQLELLSTETSERLSFVNQKNEVLTRQLKELRAVSNSDKKMKEDKQRILEQAQNELMESSVKVQKLQLLCDELQQNLSSTTSALHSTKHEVTAQVQHETQLLCNQLRTKLDGIIGTLKEEQSNYNSVNKEIVETLAKELAQATQERDLLQNALEKQQHDFLKYKDHLSQTVATLKETLDNSQTIEADKTQAQQQNFLLQQQYSQLESSYLADKDKLQREVVQLEHTLHQLQIEKNALEAVVDKSWRAAEVQEHDKVLLHQAQESYIKLQEENTRLQQSLTRVTQEIQHVMVRCSEEKEQFASETELYKAQASAFQQEKEDATIESIKLQHLCTELQLQLNESALILPTMKELERKISLLEQEKESALQSATEQRERDQVLVQEIQHSYDLLQRENSKLQEVYTRLNQEIEILTSRLIMEQQTQTSNEQLQADNLKLQQTLVRLDQEMGSLVTKFRAGEEYLNQELEAYRSRVTELQQEKEDTTIECIKLQHLCTELQLQVNSSTTAVSGYLVTIQELQPKINELENQAQIVDEENKQLKEQLISYQKEIAQLQKEREHFLTEVFDDVAKNLMDTKAKLEVGQKDNDELQSSLAILKIELDKYSVRLSSLSHVNQELKDKLETSTKQYSSLENENKKLSEELFSASQTLQNLQNILIKAELSIKENDRLSVLLSEVQSQLATSIMHREELQLKLSDKGAIIFALGREKEDLKTSLQSLYKY